MSVPDWLDSAAGYATCQILSSAGSALVGTGVATLAAGGGGIVPLTLGSLSLLAAGAACAPTPVDGSIAPPAVDGCYQMTNGGYGRLSARDGVNFPNWQTFADVQPYNDVTSISGSRVEQTGNLWTSKVTINSISQGSVEVPWEYYGSEAEASTIQWRIIPEVGTCAGESGEPIPYPPDIHDPIPYTDPATSCVYNISLAGFAADIAGGEASPVFKIESAPTGLRNAGGIVGGCNFEPVIYQAPPGGGGPPRIGPWDPTWPDWDGNGTPPWLDFLSSLAGGVLGDLIGDAIQNAFTAPVPQYQYTMRAACNYKQDGTFETYTITLPEQPWETRVLAMQEMNIDFLQQHLLWKTPTCSGGGVGIAGDPVTVNFVSDEYSLDGNNVLRKRFVYFDQTGAPLEDHVTHWKDFVWEAGPACVSFEGTPMGKPQVWASSVDEAKRVITHAAAIAGVDIADGQWMTGTSRSTRYGKPGTMRVAKFSNGNFTVTKRSGPSGNPEACG
jgi:hypothetical protein